MRKISVHTLPALVAAVLFSAGILLGRSTQMPVWLLLAASCMLFVLVLLLLLAGNKRSHAHVALLLTLLAVSLGAIKIRIDDAEADVLPADIIKRPVTATGTILDPYMPVGNRSQFLFALDELSSDRHSGIRAGATVLVTVTRQKKDTVSTPFRYGDRVRLNGQMYRPTAERNPGEFNARAYYEAQGISYLMRVRGHSNVTIVDSTFRGDLFDGMMKYLVLPLRVYILTLIDKTIGGEEGELLKGILIGERSGLPFSTRTAFVNSGIAHILAVSGSNVVVVYAFFAMFFSLLRIPRVPAILLNCVMLVLYMLLTGSQPPIVRATIMGLVVLLGKLSGGRSNSLNAIGVAALGILVFDARQLYDVGFQLSFAAVVSIIYFYPIVNAWILKLSGDSWWRKGVVGSLQISAVTLVATLGTLPLTAIYFGKVSVVGLLTNIVVLPLVGFSVSLGFVSTLFGFWAYSVAEAFAAVNYILLWLILEMAKYSGNVSWAYIETLNFKPVHALPFYLATVLVFHWHIRKVVRVAGILLLASLNLFLIVPPGRLDLLPPDRLRVSFIDVGQGDAALVEFPGGRTMLIDAGMRSEEYDAGEHIVVPFLKRRGIKVLDWMVASHPHADHIGGMLHVFEKVDVKEVIESGQPARDSIFIGYRYAVEREQAAVRHARAFDSALTINGVRLYFLYPTHNVVTPDTFYTSLNLNNTSVVMKLRYGETSWLFTGDLEQEGEAELVSLFGPFLKSDVLKVGHHGSRTSSTDQFIRHVRPSYAVISVGRNNKFNHPSESVVQRLQDVDAEVLRTDEEGAIVFESDGKDIERVVWR